MKVLIAGATGVLGRRLIQQLRDRDHNAIESLRSSMRGETKDEYIKPLA